MTWGTHCSMCGREDCAWVDGEMCEGRQKAGYKPKGRATRPTPSSGEWEAVKQLAYETATEISERKLTFIDTIAATIERHFALLPRPAAAALGDYGELVRQLQSRGDDTFPDEPCGYTEAETRKLCRQAATALSTAPVVADAFTRGWLVGRDAAKATTDKSAKAAAIRGSKCEFVDDRDYYQVCADTLRKHATTISTLTPPRIGGSQAATALSTAPVAGEAMVELGPDGKEWAKTEAGYKHVDSMIERADDKANLMWHGWALREAFVARG